MCRSTFWSCGGFCCPRRRGGGSTSVATAMRSLAVAGLQGHEERPEPCGPGLLARCRALGSSCRRTLRNAHRGPRTLCRTRRRSGSSEGRGSGGSTVPAERTPSLRSFDVPHIAAESDVTQGFSGVGVEEVGVADGGLVDQDLEPHYATSMVRSECVLGRPLKRWPLRTSLLWSGSLTWPCWMVMVAIRRSDSRRWGRGLVPWVV